MFASNSSDVTVETPTEMELVITRIFDAPRARVFDAHTKPEQLSRWLPDSNGTMHICTVDLRPGGSWHVAWRDQHGNLAETSGTYREINNPEWLVRTESWPDGSKPETLNTLILSEVCGRTVLASRTLYPSRAARDFVLTTGTPQDAALRFNRLADHLCSVAPARQRQLHIIQTPRRIERIERTERTERSWPRLQRSQQRSLEACP